LEPDAAHVDVDTEHGGAGGHVLLRRDHDTCELDDEGEDISPDEDESVSFGSDST
jgi:hypothetical protein